MTDNTLLELPIFLGMSKGDIAELREKDLMSMSVVAKGTDVVAFGQRCDRLLVVAKGSVRVITEAVDHSYVLEEVVQAPFMIQPERLFGLNQRYTSRCLAHSVCELVVIAKADVLRLMNMSIVFSMNLLNALTTRTQRLDRMGWHRQSDSIAGRVVRFLEDRCVSAAGYKLLRIKMVDLADELGCSRLEVSEALHELEQKELIRMKRSAIEIPMAERVMINLR